MNDLERQLSYPFGDTLPAPGTTLEVAPGVRWLRMGLPFALDHINLWLLRDGIDRRDGWSIVDCGVDNRATRADWEAVFASQLDGLPVLRVIVTHMHPDHLGLAHWLTERWQAPLWMSAEDHATAVRLQTGGPEIGGDAAVAFMASHGLADAASLRAVHGHAGHYTHLVPQVPAAHERLQDGRTLRIGGTEWHCIVGRGHTNEHIALHAPGAGVLISGDMVLPRISTNISVHENQPEADPLAQFLASLDNLARLPADTLVLPSHGRPFRGLRTRIGQLRDHHEAHFADVMAACREAPQSAADLLMLLFGRRLDAHQTTFAMGEAIAHLQALRHAGRLSREKGGDGVWRYATAATGS